MYTTFAVSALLAATALARGRGDGSSRWNSKSAPLIAAAADGAPADTKLTLEYYYDNNEFHGDLILEFPTVAMDPNLVFGFCFGTQTPAVKFDCLEAEYFVDVAAIVAAQADPLEKQALGDYKVLDMNTTNAGFNAFVASTYPSYDINKDVTDDAELNWRLSPNKSNAVNCKADTVADSKKVTCEKLQVHFFRNWVTTQKEEDIQITSASGDYDTRGFVMTSVDKTRTWGGSNYQSKNFSKINVAATKVAADGRTQEQITADKVAKDDRTGVVTPVDDNTGDDKTGDDKTGDDVTEPAKTDDDKTDDDKTDDLETKKTEEEKDTAAAVVATAAAMATAFGALFI